MSHASVRLLLSDVAKSLADNIQFGYGRKSEFNIISGTTENKDWIWCLPLTASGRFQSNSTSTKTKRWNVALLFLQQDQSDANHDDSAHILDTQDDLVDKYTQALDDWYERSYNTLGAFAIENDTQDPFYKDNSDIQTGWLLRFQIVVSDDFEYCSPENIQLYAGNI